MIPAIFRYFVNIVYFCKDVEHMAILFYLKTHLKRRIPTELSIVALLAAYDSIPVKAEVSNLA